MALKVNKNWLMLILSLALGGTAAYLGSAVIKNRIAAIESEAKNGKQLVKVVVPLKDLGVGTTLTTDMLAVREVPREFVHSNAVTPETLENVESQRLAVPVRRGEMLLTMHTEGVGSKVFSGFLKPGQRALTVPVSDENSISGMLRPGDRIDLIVVLRPSNTAGAGNKQDVTFPLMSNVTVLSKADANKGTERYANITLEVAPEDAHRIIVAQSSGQLKALLRNPDDVAANTTRPLTSDDLLFKRQAARTRSIELIVGGGGNSGAAVSFSPVSTLR
jgi:pilus assembly protein CpaB